MADEELPTLYLFRRNVTVSHGGANGELGFLVIGELVLYTVERRDGYVKLPNGTFECTMEAHATKGNCFRVKAEGENGHNVKNNQGNYSGILIHSANYPDQLAGCVAPGRSQIIGGVGESKKAMGDIFIFCGGFGAGKKVWLEVGDMN